MQDETVKANWNLCCPKCGHDDNLCIEVSVWVRLSVDETNQISHDHLWENDSRIYCDACDAQGLVSDFRLPGEDGEE